MTRSSVYYPGGSSIPFTATPKTYNRPWSITADVVIPQGCAGGVLLANGGRTGGYTFFVKDQRLHFLYNWLGRDRFWLHSSEKVPEGEVELRYEFEPTGKPDVAQGRGVPARCQLYINRRLVASIDMPYSVLNMFGTQGLTCGYDGGEPAAPEEYSDAFKDRILSVSPVGGRAGLQHPRRADHRAGRRDGQVYVVTATPLP